MVQLIVGRKGKGKTKHLLDKVNTEIQNVSGNIVYLDKSRKHIDVPSYLISDSDEFIGFICGIISQDHDLQQMYFDSFLKIACLENDDIEPIIKKLEVISDTFGVDFIVSVSYDEGELPESLKEKVIVSL